MNDSLDLKCVDTEGTEMRVEIILPEVKELIEQERRRAEGILQECEFLCGDLDRQIGQVTNHADGPDCIAAVIAGVLGGVVNFFLVDEFSLEEARKWGDEEVGKYVVKTAKKCGYEGDKLVDAVRFMEKKCPIAADKVTNEFGGGRQHHLRDFSHHPTPAGMLFSILTQFTQKVYGTDVKGGFVSVALKDSDLIGGSFAEKVSLGVTQWFFHMVSDMAGSSSSIAEGKWGTGLPGPLVSLIKEVSALPLFQKSDRRGYKELSVRISKLFNGTLLGERDENGKLIRPMEVDLRTEMGVGHQLGQQAIPVLVNECIVRGFYFIRRFITELKEKEVHSVKELNKINWKNTLPGKNRTIARMLTISTAVMLAINMGDAVIESAMESGGIKNPAFFKGLIVKVNYVGATRFAVAVATDVWMGVKKNRLRRAYNEMMRRQIEALHMKLYCKEAELVSKCSELHRQEAELCHEEEKLWIEVKNTREAMEDLYARVEQVGEAYGERWKDSVQERWRLLEKARYMLL